MTQEVKGSQQEVRPGVYIPSSRVREERTRRMLTMEEFAELAGIHYQTIFRVEHGYPTRGPTIRKIARALGVDPTELVE